MFLIIVRRIKMVRLVIPILLVVVSSFWPGKLEPKDLIWYHAQYPCVIMQFQDWHYVLDESGGKIRKLENISLSLAASKQ